ncbi:MAG: hypothetical protein AB1Z55_07920, partial [Acidimicrobiia bacterium]
MQTKDQILQSKRWRTVAGIAAAATLGLGAIAAASPGSDTSAPEGITLQEPGVVREVPMPDPTPPTTLVIVDDDNDSPFDDTPDPMDSPDVDSPDVDS